MRKLNKYEAQELASALGASNLKGKHVSGENFIKLINLTRSLKKALNELGGKEKEVALQLGASVNGQIHFETDADYKEFVKKLQPIHEGFSFEFEMNFIPEGELKEYTKEQDTGPTATIFEYLLKE